MMTWGLRAKLIVCVGLIVVLVLGTSTLVHIRDLKHDYLEALLLRSEALVQGILNDVRNMQTYGQNYDLNIQGVLSGLSLQCVQLHELNKEKHIAHIAVIDSTGTIAAHNDREFWSVPFDDPVLLPYLERRQQAIILQEDVYHVFIPMNSQENVYVGMIDVGIEKKAVDEKVQQVLWHSVLLLVLFVVLTFVLVSLLMHVLLTRPVGQLVMIGQEFAQGNLVSASDFAKRKDEVGVIGRVFMNISAYLREISGVASRIATGVLKHDITIRSKHDALGKAMQDMVSYLREVASLMGRVAGGDLTVSIPVRSSTDAFGQALQTMTEGLRALIAQIRTSAEQIDATGSGIASLALHDIEIVQTVNTSVENMVATMHTMGASVEDVSHNMDDLSSAVEETSASVTQMASSISHIASNSTQLTEQSHRTIQSLEHTVSSIEGIVQHADVAKQLCQDTSQGALDGRQAVEQVMTSMRAIHETVATAVEAMTRFSARSQDIAGILEVIRNITDQTSLLALNASIIAAQAGSHGRGFAVVADEIKTLAIGVGASTKDIALIVQSLQEDSVNVAQTIHEGAEKVQQGLEHTDLAQNTLQKILSSAQHTTSVISEIAETLHALMGTSQEVSTAMQQVNVMTSDITIATNEQKGTTTQITQAISHINEMASQIRYATKEQLDGVQHVLDVVSHVTTMMSKNLESSQHISRTTEELASQGQYLLSAVDRFTL